jgi:hypothetical protein
MKQSDLSKSLDSIEHSAMMLHSLVDVYYDPVTCGLNDLATAEVVKIGTLL